MIRTSTTPVHVIVLSVILMAIVDLTHAAEKAETFDHDPGWVGVNNRSALAPSAQRMVKQDFGWSKTNFAGGQLGEVGGFISPAGEVAHYGVPIPKATLD